MMVSQLLKLPKKTHLLSKEIKNKNIAIGLVILLTIVPSFFLGLSLVHKEKFKANADVFIKKVSIWDENYLLKSTVDPDKKIIKLVYAGNEFDSTSIQRIRDKADDLNLIEAKVLVEQGVKINDIKGELEIKNADFQKLSEHVGTIKEKLNRSESIIDSLHNVPRMGRSLLKEVKAFIPDVKTCSYASSIEYSEDNLNGKTVILVMFESKKVLRNIDQKKVRNWLYERLGTESVIVQFSIKKS